MGPGRFDFLVGAAYMPPEVRLEDVPVMAYAPGEDAAAPFDSDEIVAARPIPQPETAEIGRCRPRQDLLLFGIQGGCCPAEILAGSRLDLDEDGLAAVLHNEVELTAGAAPVAVARAIALGHQQ